MSEHGLNGRAESYVRSGIEACLQAIAHDSGDGYNPKLNDSSFAIGQLIAAAQMEGTPAPSRNEAEHLLFNTTVNAGYVKRRGAARAKSTIRSGLDAGLREPRDLHAALGSDASRQQRRRNGSPPDSRGHRKTNGPTRKADEHALDGAVKLEVAQRIVRECSQVDPTNETDPAAVYIRARIGNDAYSRLPPDAFSNIRFHPRCPTNHNEPDGECLPALIGILTDTMTGEPTGSIQRTFLQATGTGKADIESPKRALGAFGKDGAVILGQFSPGSHVYEAEGIEKALAIKAAFPSAVVIATLGSGRLGKCALPGGCRRTIVSDSKNQRDRDTAREAARKCAEEFGRPVWCAFPAEGFDDIDDQCCADGIDGPDGVRASLEKAEEILPDLGDLVPISPTVWEGIPPPVRHWIVPEYVPAETVTMLTGDGGAGKSTLLLQLAVARATGRRWLGFDTRPGTTVYLSAEDDADELHRRVHHIAKHYDVPMSDLGDLTLIDRVGLDATLGGLDQKTKSIKPQPLFASLDKLLAIRFAGSEIDRLQARQFVGLLKQLCKNHKLSIILLAHPSLEGMRSGTGASGSTGWSNSVRSRLYLAGEMDELPGAPAASPSDSRTLSTKKSNYGRGNTSISICWRKGAFVSVDGAAIAAEAAEREARCDAKFLEILATLMRKGRNVTDVPCATFAPTIFADHLLGDGFTKHDFKAAMKRLLTANRIKKVTSGPPSRERSSLVIATGGSP